MIIFARSLVASRAFALIKFKKSGNIYYGCYDGSCDVTYPSICTPQECYDKEDDCYKPISCCEELGDTKNWKIVKFLRAQTIQKSTLIMAVASIGTELEANQKS